MRSFLEEGTFLLSIICVAKAQNGGIFGTFVYTVHAPGSKMPLVRRVFFLLRCGGRWWSVHDNDVGILTATAVVSRL